MRRILCSLAAVVLAASPGMADEPPEVARYNVEGEIVALPGHGRAPNEILIKHKPIPDYRDVSGAVVGMHGMTMPFYLRPDVSINGLVKGDRVEFTFESRWKPSFSEQVTSIRRVGN